MGGLKQVHAVVSDGGRHAGDEPGASSFSPSTEAETGRQAHATSESQKRRSRGAARLRIRPSPDGRRPVTRTRSASWLPSAASVTTGNRDVEEINAVDFHRLGIPVPAAAVIDSKNRPVELNPWVSATRWGLSQPSMRGRDVFSLAVAKAGPTPAARRPKRRRHAPAQALAERRSVAVAVGRGDRRKTAE